MWLNGRVPFLGRIKRTQEGLALALTAFAEKDRLNVLSTTQWVVLIC